MCHHCYGYPTATGFAPFRPWHFHPDSYIHYYRQYPPVDPAVFVDSVTMMQRMTQDANQFLQKVKDSQDFAEQVMKAAQKNDQGTVDDLLTGAGIQSDADIHYNPDGLRVKMTGTYEGVDCCYLTISLRW
ncbi:hypothetical protein [Halobacillus yeomjeoni]|uniref:Uncharacterized protein n=1 Tax=Halobacillus yeomjeoni TaxID=311194 RepID=A0A931MU82_9BACI|nr:hypothetical protein [Halobacillus yeomjeoni]MBH0229230.1 hypothetical protein [Halobacillus yeomjeoni]